MTGVGQALRQTIRTTRRRRWWHGGPWRPNSETAADRVDGQCRGYW